MATAMALPVLNLETATFECTFGRGCDGICCKNGRPGLYPDEDERLAEHMDRIRPHLRPEARELIDECGYLTRRTRGGLPLVAVVKEWCVFFNEGCVLHKLGAMEGDKYRYKPVQCALFPLLKDEADRWYVRQQGYKREQWDDLFCLHPKNSTMLAAESLQEELELAARLDAENEG